MDQRAREIYFTHSRPCKKNDQATIEAKNNRLVRRYGFCYRYDTAEERAVLNRLWQLVNDRLNHLTPTIKPIDYASTADGRRRRVDDKPRTPLDRRSSPPASSHPSRRPIRPSTLTA